MSSGVPRELLRVDLNVGRRGHAHPHGLLPLRGAHDQAPVRALRLLPVAARCPRTREALLHHCRAASVEPGAEAFDARDVPPAARALEDHADVVLPRRIPFETSMTCDARPLAIQIDVARVVDL